jgi:hypothetical protein
VARLLTEQIDFSTRARRWPYSWFWRALSLVTSPQKRAPPPGLSSIFLSLFVSRDGPISQPVLIKQGFSKNLVIVTHAMKKIADVLRALWHTDF